MSGTVFRMLWDGLASVVFPQACVLCLRPVDSLGDGVTCSVCWQAMPDLTAQARCPRCHAPLFVRRPASDRNACDRCEGMTLDLFRFIGPYEGALRANVLRLKTQPQVCRRLREKIVAGVLAEPLFRRADVVIPVPLHPQRQRERGYNQAERIARIAAAALARPMVTDVLVRIKFTVAHRAGMDEVARRASLSQAFAVRDAAVLSGKTILLIDDVYTTGTTLTECARAIRRAQAAAVFGFAIARVLG